jgi:ABC-type uncharacterized transport system substrate-binding protein
MTRSGHWGFGLVASLSHPGGNVTGLANFAEILASKQIDFLREVLPRLRRLGSRLGSCSLLFAPQGGPEAAWKRSRVD